MFRSIAIVVFLIVLSSFLRADSPPGLKPGSPVTEVRQAQTAWAGHLGVPATKTVQLAPGLDIQLALIPPGEFRMGSPETENPDNATELPHEVSLTKPWFMGHQEVTQAQWKAVMGANPARFAREQSADLGTFPVENVSYNDCQEFITRLRRLTGLPFRLPTEAEWEFAARAGTTTAYPWGNVLNGREANCNGGKPFGTMDMGPALGKPCKVGSYSPNALGLVDTAGNVFEWCADWHAKYDPAQGENPAGPNTGRYRVVRGGSFGSPANLCRSGRRLFNDPTSKGSSIGIGLRLALDIPEEPKTLGKLDPSRLLVLGNSVTHHGPLKAVSWDHNWGMAASAPENDFAHLLRDHLAKAAGGHPELRVKNLAGFERNLAAFNLEQELKEEFAFKPTVIVVALGRNAKEPTSDADKDAYFKAYTRLLKTLNNQGNARVFVRSEFWDEPAKEAQVKKACAATGVQYVDIGAPANDPANLGSAERKYEHAGVAGHPGDKGMRAIADRLWQGMQTGN